MESALDNTFYCSIFSQIFCVIITFNPSKDYPKIYLARMIKTEVSVTQMEERISPLVLWENTMDFVVKQDSMVFSASKNKHTIETELLRSIVKPDMTYLCLVLLEGSSNTSMLKILEISNFQSK